LPTPSSSFAIANTAQNDVVVDKNTVDCIAKSTQKDCMH
jgi:hypothetical protein